MLVLRIAQVRQAAVVVGNPTFEGRLLGLMAPMSLLWQQAAVVREAQEWRPADPVAVAEVAADGLAAAVAQVMMAQAEEEVHLRRAESEALLDSPVVAMASLGRLAQVE